MKLGFYYNIDYYNNTVSLLHVGNAVLNGEFSANICFHIIIY